MISFFWPQFPEYRVYTDLITLAVLMIFSFVLYRLVKNRKILMADRRHLELEQKNHELQLANSRILESEKMKDKFLAAVSHELRTPLTLILAPAETLLTEESDSKWDDRKRSLVTKIHSNSVRLLQLITGLLDHARIESGDFEIQKDEFDAVVLSRNLLGEFQPLIKHRGLTGNFECKVDSLIVCQDRYVFERILFNLLSNAIKFTPVGGQITLRILLSSHRHFVVEVIDTGIGIPSGLTSSIFEKFRQLESSSSRRFEGVGLGLALVKEFVDLVGAKITVESEPGAGSTFRVDFPYEPSRAEKLSNITQPLTPVTQYFDAARTEEAPAYSSHLPSIVVAEDNQELAHYMKEILTPFSNVKIASNGDEASHIILSTPPDLIIADVMMPILSGIELCKRVKQDERTATIPVLLLTALLGRDELIKGWEAGADDYLHKPFHPQELVTRVKTLISLYKIRCEREENLRKTTQTVEARIHSVPNITTPSPSKRQVDESLSKVWDLLKGRDDIVRGAVRTLRKMEDSTEMQIIADKLELALIKGEENRQ